MKREPERFAAGERCDTDLLRPGPGGEISGVGAKHWKMRGGVDRCCG